MHCWRRRADMLVWMTRSRPGAERQAEVLRAHGFETLVVPVMSIVEVVGALPPASVSSVMFLSEHGVRLGMARVKRAGIDLNAVPVYAVGSRTAACLAQFHIVAETPQQSSSEGILELPAFADPSSMRILIVTGEGGRGVLASTLRDRGAEVSELVAYRRVAVDRFDHDVGGVDVIAVGSGDGLEFAARLWFAASGRADVAVLVPSDRVAALGARVGFTNVRTCEGAGADALLDGLAALTGPD